MRTASLPVDQGSRLGVHIIGTLCIPLPRISSVLQCTCLWTCLWFLSYHSFSVLDSFICLWLSLCSAVFVPHSLLVKDNAIMLCQESSPSFERLEIHSSFTGPKMGTISVFPPVLTYSVSVYHLSFWHIQVVFAGSGAKIRRENFEVYHRTLMVLLNLVVKHQVPPSMAGCIKLLSSLFSKRTPNGKEHRQSPEKCAAGLQQLIDLSRGDRSEKCHEVFCIFLYGISLNFAMGQFGKDELAQRKSNALTHLTQRLIKTGMTKAQQWKTDFVRAAKALSCSVTKAERRSYKRLCCRHIL